MTGVVEKEHVLLQQKNYHIFVCTREAIGPNNLGFCPLYTTYLIAKFLFTVYPSNINFPTKYLLRVYQTNVIEMSDIVSRMKITTFTVKKKSAFELH